MEKPSNDDGSRQGEGPYQQAAGRHSRPDPVLVPLQESHENGVGFNKVGAPPLPTPGPDFLPVVACGMLVLSFWYAVRPPHIHGAGVNALRYPTLLGHGGARGLPARHHRVPVTASISISSDTLPRLKHLRFTNVSVRTDDTKAAITLLADDLRTIRMSCRRYSKTESPSEPVLFLCHSGVTAVFTKYSLFRLRAPKLAVFEWRCCYADEVRIEAVGCLSDVAIEVAAGTMPTPTPIVTEPKYMTIQQRDKLMTDILQGLMPGLQPRTWKDVSSKRVEHL
ncbi:unnamed protein product [Miscanthus lutarioriparius]|uniref:Uncharacterized protein n=1 Tax=Miscanthus lutarioriparius TaxID=422564 RepID=A0A811SAM2_9POAL|nr:unnamed protein product [Miscanthus lutarioriparius]